MNLLPDHFVSRLSTLEGLGEEEILNLVNAARTFYITECLRTGGHLGVNSREGRQAKRQLIEVFRHSFGAVLKTWRDPE